jgi:hypothetical protein
MTPEQIDHVAVGVSRIAQQYKNAGLFRQFVQAMLSRRGEIEKALTDVYNMYDYDTATGKSLDIIADIVGTARVVKGGFPLAFFGFVDEVAPKTFGELSDRSIGGQFRELGQNSTTGASLADSQLTTLIKSKINYNMSHSYNPEVIQSLIDILGAENVVNYVDNLDMTVTVTLSSTLSYLMKTIITKLPLLPRGDGVQIIYQ